MINVWWIWDPTKQFGPRVHTLASSTPRSRLLHSTLSSHGVTLRGCYFILMMVTKTRVSNDVLKGCIAWMRQRQDPLKVYAWSKPLLLTVSPDCLLLWICGQLCKEPLTQN